MFRVPVQQKYVRHKNGHVDNDVMHVDKIKDLNRCKDHQISHSNIDGEAYGDGKTGFVQVRLCISDKP